MWPSTNEPKRADTRRVSGALPAQLITPQVEPRLYLAFIAKVRDFDCHLLAIGGVEDQVHLFVRFPPTVALSLLMKEVKGAPSPR
jgi:REP element-mobilizing transposase RayT